MTLLERYVFSLIYMIIPVFVFDVNWEDGSMIRAIILGLIIMLLAEYAIVKYKQ